MFATIGHTFELMKMSWRVLMKDRELILFPIMSGIVLIAAIAAFAGIGAATGSLERLDAMSSSGSTGAATEEARPVDYVLGASLYVVAYFIVIFFNAALVSAALERLRGGNPTVGSGLRAASSHLPQILGWAIIAATVGLILQAIRDRMDNFLGRMVIGFLGAAWTYATFFVIPVLVAEGIGPIGAIKRSGGLFRETWGRQFTASFGFGLVYIVALLIAFLPAAALFTISPVAGLLAGTVLFALAIGTVQALEGIFKAALYEFSLGERPQGFDRETLSSAYRAL
ncbi:MAG: hypothetical protein GEU80_08765 [Dehalococcoidia bacterium]|nr:hypothetical protein [Dehalococcoidia bacterium]